MVLESCPAMNRNEPHNLIALTAMEKISGLGISYVLQQRIGAFAVCWGMFESHLEGAIWALQEEDVKGARPSTDKMPSSEWLKVLAAGHVSLSPDANAVLSLAADAAENLMSYRHSLLHGMLVPIPGAPFFIRNPRWNGEMRKRESGDAHVDENLLDMAIEAAWILFRVALLAKRALHDPSAATELEASKKEVRRARSFAGELRHLAALMNHEKY